VARRNPLRELMQTNLPPISVQKRKLYRPKLSEVKKIYDLLNRYIFDNRLVRPPIQIGVYKKYWGLCLGHDKFQRKGTYCKIKLVDKWYCIQWLVTTLAHEMVHQYEWDVLRKPMTHRQSFFIWKSKLAKFNIDLKTYHRSHKWFKYQDFYKA